MTKRLIASYQGLQEYAHIDPMRPDDLHLETYQDCQPILDYAKQMRDRPVGKEWRHVAAIPLCIYDQAVKEGWDKDQAKWHAWLNDPDNALFRTWPGRIGKSGQH